MPYGHARRKRVNESPFQHSTPGRYDLLHFLESCSIAELECIRKGSCMCVCSGERELHVCMQWGEGAACVYAVGRGSCMCVCSGERELHVCMQWVAIGLLSPRSVLCCYCMSKAVVHATDTCCIWFSLAMQLWGGGGENAAAQINAFSCFMLK